MNFNEYQAKELFAEYGIAVPAGKVANTPDLAVDAAKALGAGPWMVKAQIHAGGRGKSGGVKFCKTHAEVRAAAAGMLGTRMATYQSAGRALPVHEVLVTDAGDISKELYLSMLVDRGSKAVAFIASSRGGVDIEQVARETPRTSTPSRLISSRACSLTSAASWVLPWVSIPGRSASSARSCWACTSCSTSRIWR
ncbi:succinyl-CoA synthetase beta subunit [mine drainage metagenome]|uniref:Succinyl-CoA synthetase beta subunit n=1 Tax=mine drainage metagenome TaxID=410659 RepID=T1BFQ0_9ZZZZ